MPLVILPAKFPKPAWTMSPWFWMVLIITPIWMLGALGSQQGLMAHWGITEGGKDAGAKCEHGRVYVYDLPFDFHHGLLYVPGSEWYRIHRDWPQGMGDPIEDARIHAKEVEGAWFKTEQGSTDVMLHWWMVNRNPCRTPNPEKATAFFVPWYASTEYLIRNKVNQATASDELRASAYRLINRLKDFGPYWSRHQGKDHIFVVGRCMTDIDKDDDNMSWGSNTWHHVKELSGVIALTIEKSPTVNEGKNNFAIPYPSYFHPASAQALQRHLDRIQRSDRKKLVTFVGGERQDKVLRMAVLEQCRASQRCEFIDCSVECTEYTELRLIELFASSVFCLQPGGDTPTRRSIFDSILAGCIPVLFRDAGIDYDADAISAVDQYVWHMPNVEKYAVIVDGKKLRDEKLDLVDMLGRISHQRVKAMQEALRAIIPRVTYSNWVNGTVDWDDAFVIATREALSVAAAARKQVTAEPKRH